MVHIPPLNGWGDGVTDSSGRGFGYCSQEDLNNIR